MIFVNFSLREKARNSPAIYMTEPQAKGSAEYW